jgi:hypothetical protein
MLTIGFLRIIRYDRAIEEFRVQCQRYFVATLVDTNKVERFALLCAYLPFSDVPAF